jgi:hypothetical protein
MAISWIEDLRRNHALEHATASILIPRMKPGSRLLARAGLRGFHIYADVPNQVVSQAAHEALARLKQGKSGLAISPLCGTNLVTAALLAGIASVALNRRRGRNVSLPTTILASLAAIVVSQPLGRQAQRLTTSADVGGMEIDAVNSQYRGRYLRHEIRTLQGRYRSSGEHTLQSP